MKYKTEKLRIDKYLGNMGVGSRSEIKRYINHPDSYRGGCSIYYS